MTGETLSLHLSLPTRCIRTYHPKHIPLEVPVEVQQLAVRSLHGGLQRVPLQCEGVLSDGAVGRGEVSLLTKDYLLVHEGVAVVGDHVLDAAVSVLDERGVGLRVAEDGADLLAHVWDCTVLRLDEVS